jgi:hypothetical protein
MVFEAVTSAARLSPFFYCRSIMSVRTVVSARSVLAYVMAVLPYMYAHAPHALAQQFYRRIAKGSSAARVRHVARILTMSC